MTFVCACVCVCVPDDVTQLQQTPSGAIYESFYERVCVYIFAVGFNDCICESENVLGH